MKRIIFAISLLLGLGLAQHKQVIVTKIQESETIRNVDVSIEDGILTVTIDDNGDKKVFKADMNSEDEMEALADMLNEMNIDIDIFSEDGDNGGLKWFHDSQGFLGVQLNDLTPQLRKYFKVSGDNGVLVAEVVPDSPAEEAGLKAGDVILSVDGKKIEDAEDLSRTIRRLKPETEVTLAFVRKGKHKTRQVTLGEAERPSFAFMTQKHGMPMMEDFPMKWKMFRFDDEDEDLFPFRDDDIREEVEQLKNELRALREEIENMKN